MILACRSGSRGGWGLLCRARKARNDEIQASVKSIPMDALTRFRFIIVLNGKISNNWVVRFYMPVFM